MVTDVRHGFIKEWQLPMKTVLGTKWNCWLETVWSTERTSILLQTKSVAEMKLCTFWTIWSHRSIQVQAQCCERVCVRAYACCGYVCLFFCCFLYAIILSIMYAFFSKIIKQYLQTNKPKYSELSNGDSQYSESNNLVLTLNEFFLISSYTVRGHSHAYETKPHMCVNELHWARDGFLFILILSAAAERQTLLTTEKWITWGNDGLHLNSCVFEKIG